MIPPPSQNLAQAMSAMLLSHPTPVAAGSLPQTPMMGLGSLGEAFSSPPVGAGGGAGGGGGGFDLSSLFSAFGPAGFGPGVAGVGPNGTKVSSNVMDSINAGNASFLPGGGVSFKPFNEVNPGAVQGRPLQAGKYAVG